MRLRFATIPLFGDPEAEAELNRFLAAHRVLSLERQLVSTGNTSVWAICVTYEQSNHASELPSSRKKAGHIDYREHLSAPDFALYSKLRSLRKSLAEREGVPVYALFNNEQLAAMVQQRAQTMESLQRLPGVGPVRVEKYGAEFLKLLHEVGEGPPHESDQAPQAPQDADASQPGDHGTS